MNELIDKKLYTCVALYGIVVAVQKLVFVISSKIKISLRIH
jgi:hypothetical protein